MLVIKFAGNSQRQQPEKISSDIKQEILERAADRVQEPSESPPVSVAPSKVEKEPMELKISANATDSCWIELETISIVDQQPESSIYIFNLQPGRSRTFQATEEFRFRKVGNAGGIVLELNGVKLPELGKRGKVISDYRVTRDNLPKSTRGE